MLVKIGNKKTEFNIKSNQNKTNYIAPYVASESEAHKWQRLG